MLGTIIGLAAAYTAFATASRNLSNAADDEIFEIREDTSNKRR